MLLKYTGDKEVKRRTLFIAIAILVGGQLIESPRLRRGIYVYFIIVALALQYIPSTIIPTRVMALVFQEVG